MTAYSGERTAAQEYDDRHYRECFRFGEGTEDILSMLGAIPAVDRWVDVGSGSQTLLWALALIPGSIIAADADPRRLELLARTARQAVPGPVHATAVQLCKRGRGDYADRCRRLTRCLRGLPDRSAPSTPAPAGGRLRPDHPIRAARFIVQRSTFHLCVRRDPSARPTWRLGRRCELGLRPRAQPRPPLGAAVSQRRAPRRYHADGP